MYKTYVNIAFFLSICTGFSQPEIPKKTAPIQLDGSIEPAEWQNAYVLTDFKQIEPNLGARASEQVVVKVLYDAQYLYVSAQIPFTNPSTIFATTLERDKAQTDDDYFEFYIDSYNDKLNTLVFRTNPLGTKQDLEISRNGEDFNNSWNTFWNAASQIHHNGWSTEMRIPFSSLRYEASAVNTMRIKAIVKYKQKNERIISPQYNTQIASAHYHFSNSEAVQFKNLPASKPLYITPYLKGNFISQNLLNENGTAYKNQTTFLERKKYADSETLDKILSNIGLDVKYKPTANSTIDFTLNTDFAEVEADDRVVNISRFPIFLAEKRLFFLENADLFNSNQFDHRLFNSRRIGIENGSAIPIIGGVRFTGNSSTWQYGLLSMQTHKVENIAASNNMSVARLRKTVGSKGSNIGILNTNKISKDESNHLLAIDANIRFTDIIRSRFTVAATFDTQTGNWKPMYGAAVNTFRPNGFGIDYYFREYTENFNPELGFVERPNTKRLTLNNGWRKTYANPEFLRFFRMGHYFTKYWLSSNGVHEVFQTNFYLTLTHKKGYELSAFIPMYLEDNLYAPWQIAKDVTVPVGAYTMWKANPFFSTGNAKPYQLYLDVEFGDFYGGKQLTTYANVSYDFSKTLKAELGMRYNRLSFPESYATNKVSRTLNLNRYFSRVKLNFSPKASLNSYVQYDTRSNKAGLNLRFRYNPTEGTDLYLVYNHNAHINRDALTPRPPFTDNQVAVVKFSKTFLR
ncbi:carbohydrate binding family 9 domain-containing protein [Hwangdonia lutea]|uniref:DUF5916 domain-containing protein n=1 Tax=Hwangdonia lutea TaxID=3075823 RepID=A0AA97EMA9_9FLAO|nr:DUF5916 domain-containing protein [Hwangdonia sp. SCSIO 19198]WOD44036.1 DUF5916 domain-containing protein [Hwangdonia sp. SCSIO 19198]